MLSSKLGKLGRFLLRTACHTAARGESSNSIAGSNYTLPHELPAPRPVPRLESALLSLALARTYNI